MSNLAKITLRVHHGYLKVAFPSSILGCQHRCMSDDVRFLDLTSGSGLKRGKGGRSSFSGVVATVFGSSGFLGKYLCNRLGKWGTQLILPYRADHSEVRHLKLLGDLGQVFFQPYHLCDEEAIRKAVKYSNVVINLVGRDYETPNFNFHQVNVEGAERIARISKEMGVKKFVHVSALNSNISHPGYFTAGGSKYLQTKGEGEEVVRDVYPDAIIFRPSDVYGQFDRFLHFLNQPFRYVGRYLPLPYSGKDIWKQPVYVGDVAYGIASAVYDDAALGKTFEAVGPRRYELAELVDWFHRVTMKEDFEYSRSDLAWQPLAYPKLIFNQYSPWAPLRNYTFDKIEREAISDEVVGLPNLEDLGVTLTKMEDRVNWELSQFKTGAHYWETVGGKLERAEPPKFVDPYA